MRRLMLFAFLICASTPSNGAAQTMADYDYANLRFRGIGFDYGYIWPTKVDPTSLYSMRIDLGYLGPGVRIAPTISYWNSTLHDSELRRFADQLNRLPALESRGIIIQPEELGRIEWSDLSVSVDAHVVWTTPLNVMTYIGGGLGLHAMNGRGSAVEETFVEDLLDSTTAGFNLMAGGEFQVLPQLRLYGEARFSMVSDIRVPGFRVGGALMLPSRTTATSQGGS